MSSETDLCNTALLRVGVSTTIANLTENTKEARICNRLYARVRDYVLRDFPWNFATRRVVLSLTGTAPTNWEFQYAYPSDCLTVRDLVQEGLRVLRTDQRAPFEVGTDGTYKVIWTDMELAELVYTSRVEDLTLWDPMAESALAWALAAELGTALAVKPELAQMARTYYVQTVHAAAAAMANESWAGPAPLNEILAARGFSG